MMKNIVAMMILRMKVIMTMVMLLMKFIINILRLVMKMGTKSVKIKHLYSVYLQNFKLYLYSLSLYIQMCNLSMLQTALCSAYMCAQQMTLKTDKLGGTLLS